jgi:outer membrane protein OmpA-like peptidoglycan-associated protein
LPRPGSRRYRARFGNLIGHSPPSAWAFIRTFEENFMRARFRFALVAVAALLAARGAAAEPLGSYFTVTPFAGYTTFDANLKFPAAPLKDDLYAGARVGWWSGRWWGVEAAGGFTPTRENVEPASDVNFWHASGNLMLTPIKSRTGDMFLFGGYGYSNLNAQLNPAANYVAGTQSSQHRGTVELGGGVRIWMTDVIGVRLEARNVSMMQKDPKIKFENNNLVFGGGIELALGARPRDTDGDGVPDKKDKCPDTPMGAKVDANGCPLDTDGDGIFDGLDQCPGTPKGCKVDGKGCPIDSDGDGVCDGVDQCPDTPKGATVDATGCAKDSDGDGVLDGLDKCPDTPRGATVDSTGCPKDSDGDGVLDGLDKCPDTPQGAKVDVNGCPIEIMERETEMLDTGMIRLQNVNFETAKAELLPEDFATLDVVGEVLVKWPALRVEIGGHTDSRGSATKNQKLSEARASAVLTYLTQKFPTLKAEQFTVKGYGKSKPVAPNNNELNMARNRRVEFVVENKDVLKKEIERRRLLQKADATPPAGAAPAPTAAPADTTRK